MVDDAWLALVRMARDAGDVSSLLPPGVKSMYDAPHVFVVAVTRALQFLKFEELPEEERPPKWMWLDNERMTRWWDEVRLNRRSKTGAPNVPDMERNELMGEFFKGVKFRG
jgi:hypothetical protein